MIMICVFCDGWQRNSTPMLMVGPCDRNLCHLLWCRASVGLNTMKHTHTDTHPHRHPPTPTPTHLHDRYDPNSSFICKSWQHVHQLPQERQAAPSGCISCVRALEGFSCLASINGCLVVCRGRLSVCQSVVQVNIILSFYRSKVHMTVLQTQTDTTTARRQQTAQLCSFYGTSGECTEGTRLPPRQTRPSPTCSSPAHATAPCSSSALLSPPELPSSSPLPFFCSSRCCSVFLAPPSPAPGGVRVLGEEEEEPCCSCCSSSC